MQSVKRTTCLLESLTEMFDKGQNHLEMILFRMNTTQVGTVLLFKRHIDIQKELSDLWPAASGLQLGNPTPELCQGTFENQVDVDTNSYKSIETHHYIQHIYLVHCDLFTVLILSHFLVF